MHETLLASTEEKSPGGPRPATNAYPLTKSPTQLSGVAMNVIALPGRRKETEPWLRDVLLAADLPDSGVVLPTAWSPEYVEKWRGVLADPVRGLREVVLAPNAPYGMAMMQNSPFGFLLADDRERRVRTP